MRAAYGKVTNIKAFQSTGVCRVEIEMPIEAYRECVALLFDQRALVTVAPEIPSAYGIVEPEQEPEPEPAKSNVIDHPRRNGFAQLGPVCSLAVRWCDDPEFWAFLLHEHNEKVASADAAAKVIRSYCGIKSRKELDEPDVKEIFDGIFRDPFMAWQNPKVAARP